MEDHSECSEAKKIRLDAHTTESSMGAEVENSCNMCLDPGEKVPAESASEKNGIEENTVHRECSSYSHLPKGKRMANEPSPGKLQRFNSCILSFMKEQNIPGASLVISKGEDSYIQCYGWATHGIPLRPHHLLRIASISKVFTAVAIMKLYEDGKLDLNGRVFGPEGILKAYQPAKGFLDRRVAKITVAHLLRHRAGWDREVVGDPCFWRHVGQDMGVPEPVLPYTLIMYMLEKQKLQNNPGSHYAYSNLGYLVLGRVIEQASGQSYESYVQDLLAQVDIVGPRLGRTKTAFPDEVEYFPWPSCTSVDSVYPGEGKVPSPYGAHAMESGDADGGWIATPLHLVQLFQSLDGTRQRIVKPETFSLMLEKQSRKIPGDSWYGFGLEVWRKMSWEHSGHIDGATGVVVHNRNGFNLALLCNYWPPDSDYSSFLAYQMSGVEGWGTLAIRQAVLLDTATIDLDHIVKVCIPYGQHNEVIADVTSKGYMVTWLSAYQVDGRTFFTMIFKASLQESEPNLVHIDVEKKGLLSLLRREVEQGYVPSFVDTYTVKDTLLYAVIMGHRKDDSTEWILCEDLTLEEMQHKTKELKGDGFSPIVQSLVRLRERVHACMLYVKDGSVKAWPQHGKTITGFEKECKNQQRLRHMLPYAKAYRETQDSEIKFSLIWSCPGPYRYYIQQDLSMYGLLNEVVSHSENKFQPWSICGYEYEDEGLKMHNFVAMCAKRVPHR